MPRRIPHVWGRVPAGHELVWVSDALQAFTEEAQRTGLEYFKAWYATDPDDPPRP